MIPIKKCIAVFLALCCLLAPPAAAAKTARYVGISNVSIVLQTTDSNCRIMAHLLTYSGYHSSIDIFLEERAPGGSWHPLQNWSVSSTATLLRTEKQHPGTPGCTYRVTYHVQVYTTNGQLAEDFTQTTAEKTMPG